ncbi:MAG: NADH-quinone oxidoreductase subunit NuoG [Chloroflexota bacterium]
MPTIYVDNEPYEVEDGQNLLQACLTLGFDLPFFCWHPAMHSVGACRQCAVKQFRDEKDTRGRIVMACMTPAADGTRISIDDPDAKAFRASAIEWLMLNHPHDCPVCDEGSECHLQDMTVMTGHVYRRSRFKKRTYRNQYLGPFVNHELNRCIQCYRCVRYYRDYAGGRDLNVFAAHDSVYFGRYEDGVLENEFAGNLVEVCPTGVFTDRTFSSHYSRKWDLQTAPSICLHCSVGCNTIPGERYDQLRRIRTRYNDEVNWNFLCDRGRFGYEFVNSERRIRQPLIPTIDQPVTPASAAPAPTREAISVEVALQHVAALMSGARGVIGIGSPRASLEANFALRTLVGPDNFYLGMSEKESPLVSTLLGILRRSPAPSASLKQVRESDAVLVLGEDVTNTAPMMALALRQSARQQPLRKVAGMGIPLWNDAAAREVIGQETGPLFLATVSSTRLEDAATSSYYGAPADLARLGFAVAEAVSGETRLGEGSASQGLPDEARDLAGTIARALMEAEQPLIVSGTSLGSEEILQAAANVAWALQRAGRPARLSLVVPECNTVGLGLMGEMRPGEAFRAVREGRADTAIVLENDLYRRAEAAEVDAFFAAARHVVVLDHLATPTAEKAEVALPAATFAESDGTLVNQEGRAQRFYQVFVPRGSVQESWRWLRDLGVAAGWDRPMAWDSLDDVIAALVETLPLFKPVAEVAPPASFRIQGMKIARQHYRYSGRTATTANIDVSEPKPPDDPDSPLVFSMEGYQGQPPAPLVPRFWAPGWNSEQSLTKFQEEVSGPLRGGPAGKRLIEPPRDRQPAPFEGMPAAFEPRPGEWLAVPLYHIFGSEELSILTKGVAELAPRPYLALSPQEAERHGLREGEELSVELGGRQRRLALRLIPTLPLGMAGVPVGLPGLEGVALPTRIQWSRR